jgi:hypothetical protein
VVVWAPGADRAPIAAAARDLGAAVIDRTPAPAALPQTDGYLRAGIAAYDKLDFDAAWTKLEQARELADRTGAAGLTAAQLSDLFLYRGLVQAQRGNPTWDEIVIAAIVDPTRVLDKARFPPKVVDEVNRAHGEVLARPRRQLAIDVPAGCTVTIDGHAPTPATGELVGLHWVNVRCPDRAPWGERISVLDADMTLKPVLVAFEQPSDTDLLVQARAAGARAMIVAELRGQIATARLIGADGRERDRRSVAITGDLAPLADAIRMLGSQRETRERWYQRRWVWAAGAAALAAAVLVPVTAAVAGDSGPTDTATIRVHTGAR